MSRLYARMNRIELRTHKIFTRSDWLLLAEKWKSQLERFDAVPEKFKEEAIDALRRGDEIYTTKGSDEYRIFLKSLMKETPEVYPAMMYFTAMQMAGREKEVTWIRISERTRYLLMELRELRKHAKKSKR